MRKAGLLLLCVFDTTVLLSNEEEMKFHFSFDSSRPFFFSRKNNKDVKLMLKSRTEHYQGFWEDLDKKLQEYNCSLHVTEMTLS